MRFDCEQCKAKYSIDDARVRGKILKIRCKACGNVITVRESAAAAQTDTPAATASQGTASPGGASRMATPASTPAPAPPVPPVSEARPVAAPDAADDRTIIAGGPPAGDTSEAPEWFVSCDGQQEGPFFAAQAAQRAREMASGGLEVHAWREGFGDWQPVGEVPELAALFRPAIAPPAAPPAPAQRPRVPDVVPTRERSAPVVPKTPRVPEAMENAPARPPSRASAAADSPFKAAPPRPEEEPAGSRPSPFAASLAEAAARGNGSFFGPGDAKDLAKPSSSRPKDAAPRDRGTPAESLPARVRHTGEEEGLTPLPTPAFYSGEFPLDELLTEGDASPAPAQNPEQEPRGGGIEFPADLPGAGAGAGPSDTELLISEPSVMVPLPIMMEVAKTASATPVEAPLPATPEPPLQRRGGIITVAVLGVAALGLVVYLVFGRTPGDPAAGPRAGHKIDDTPVALLDNPVAGNGPQGQGQAGKPPATTGAGATAKPSHGGPSTPRTVNDPKIKTTSPLTAPSLNELAGEGRSLERTPTDLTGSQSGKVNPEDMLRVVRQNKKSVELCYERGLKFDSNLKGKVEVELKVGISGRVTDVKLNDPAVAASQLGMCLGQTIKRWNFPSSGSEYSFSFPLILQAN